jgi:hypothetical protein
MTTPPAVGAGGNRLYPALLHCFTNYPYHIFPLYTNNSTDYEFWVCHAAEFHTVVSIYVPNAHSTLLRNSGYNVNFYNEQCSCMLLQNNNLQHGVVTQKTTKWGWGGGVHVRYYVCLMVQNTMRNSLFVPKNDVSPAEGGEVVGETYLQPRFQERWIGP